MFFRILEGTGSAEGCSFHGIPDADSIIRSIFQEILNLSGLIRKTQDDFIDSAASHQIDLIEQKRFVCYGNNGFRGVERQRTESRSLPAGENESFHQCRYTKNSPGLSAGCTRISAVNLPNALTLVRIFAVPLLVALLLTKDHMLVAALIFLAASFTDLLDGYLARKRGQIPTLGALLDPLADKLLISAAFISLIELHIVPAWMVVIIVGREFAVNGLRSIAVTQGFTISASDLGKIKMVAQVAAIALLILGHEIPVFNEAGKLALYVVVLFALVSAVDYFRKFWTQIDDRFKAQERQRSILNQKQARRDVPIP